MEDQKKLWLFNEKVSKKTQLSMAVSMDYYKQAHLFQNSLGSMSLGVLTSCIY